MIITTTDNIRYYEIGEYLDVVSAMSMYAASTKISSSTISQDELYETCFEKTKQKIVKQALKIQADAIVGLTVEYLSKDDTSDMVLSLTGTAVRFKQTKEWAKTQKERAAAGLTEVYQEEEKALTEQEKQALNFKNVCDRLTEKYNLDEKAHDVLLGFEAFQLFKKVADVHKKVPSIEDRLEVMRILRDLESKGIIREDNNYYMIDDTVILK